MGGFVRTVDVGVAVKEEHRMEGLDSDKSIESVGKGKSGVVLKDVKEEVLEGEKWIVEVGEGKTVTLTEDMFEREDNLDMLAILMPLIKKGAEYIDGYSFSLYSDLC